MYLLKYADGFISYGDAVSTSITGIIVVMIILALLAVLVLLLSKAVRAVESAAKKGKKAEIAPKTVETPVSKGVALPDTQSAGKLDLVNVDDKTAAVIMAIVSNESGIPLNRLQFNSIKKIEE